MIVEGGHAAVAQRQLELTYALLTGYAARHGTVDLVRQPVLAGHSLQLEHTLQVFLDALRVIFHGCELSGYLVVADYCLGGGAEHIGHCQVDGLAAILLAEYEPIVAGGASYYVEGGLFALRYGTYLFDVLGAQDETHAFLALVADYFLGRQGGVADGQRVDVDFATGVLHQLGEGVEVSAGAVVVDADAWVAFQGADHVADALLHLRVGTLHGVELDGVGILAGSYGGDGAATHADAVVVATHHHHAHVGLRLAFQGVVGRGVADAACKHDDLVVGQQAVLLRVLKSEYGTAD